MAHPDAGSARRPDVFLLSPAFCGGRRGAVLTSRTSPSTWAQRLAAGELSLGDAFAFVSGLYFRGKLAYARHFASVGERRADVLIITPSRGLQSPETIVTAELLSEFARIDLASDDERYRRPLLRDTHALHAGLPPGARVALLGSVATPKYLEPLADVLGDRLCFPGAFVGRGDMSRGALLLRSVTDNSELDYVSFSVGVARRGKRPPRLR